MIRSRRQAGQCVFCTFRVTELPPTCSRRIRPSGARWSSQNAAANESQLNIRKIKSVQPYASPAFTRARSSKAPRKSGPSSRPLLLHDRSVRKAEPAEDSTHGLFLRLLKEHMQVITKDIQQNPGQSSALTSGRVNLGPSIKNFVAFLENCVRDAEEGKAKSKGIAFFNRLRSTFINGSQQELRALLKHSFIASLTDREAEVKNPEALRKIADLSNPIEWYPATRALQRKVHLHLGPTNSGKTYHALKRLQEAKTGVFAGPLRLLAHEVYTRFNAAGKPCALITGEEKRIPPGMKHVMQSCTVEMTPLNCKVDVAVIDEIQMLGNEERGWAWTQAFLGIQAKELHLCGEVRTEQLVRNLCTLTGDELVIHRYERLNPLEMEPSSLNGKLENIRKGDCIVVFSRVGIHAMKAQIERVTGKRCAVVYGALPPETRAQQAALFNDPDNDYDYLVASDAVGMGLNLSIRRVVFETSTKHDGMQYRLMKPWEIKQIAGRAGRYRTAHQANIAASSTSITDIPEVLPVPATEQKNIGWVTTLDVADYRAVRRSLNVEPPPMQTAYIMPPDNIVLQFARHFPPSVSFAHILFNLWDQVTTGSLFSLVKLKDQLDISNMIADIPLTTADRVMFISAPINSRNKNLAPIVRDFASCIASNSDIDLLDFEHLDLEILEMDIHEHPEGSKGYLRAAENLHTALTLYLWLSYRFAGIFKKQELAFHTKTLIEAKIDQCLAEVNYDVKIRQRALQRRLKDLEKEKAERENRRLAGLEDGLGLASTEPAVDENLQDVVDEKNQDLEDAEEEEEEKVDDYEDESEQGGLMETGSRQDDSPSPSRHEHDVASEEGESSVSSYGLKFIPAAEEGTEQQRPVVRRIGSSPFTSLKKLLSADDAGFK